MGYLSSGHRHGVAATLIASLLLLVSSSSAFAYSGGGPGGGGGTGPSGGGGGGSGGGSTTWNGKCAAGQVMWYWNETAALNNKNPSAEYLSSHLWSSAPDTNETTFVATDLPSTLGGIPPGYVNPTVHDWPIGSGQYYYLDWGCRNAPTGDSGGVPFPNFTLGGDINVSNAVGALSGTGPFLVFQPVTMTISRDAAGAQPLSSCLAGLPEWEQGYPNVPTAMTPLKFPGVGGDVPSLGGNGTARLDQTGCPGSVENEILAGPWTVIGGEQAAPSGSISSTTLPGFTASGSTISGSFQHVSSNALGTGSVTTGWDEYCWMFAFNSSPGAPAPITFIPPHTGSVLVNGITQVCDPGLAQTVTLPNNVVVQQIEPVAG